MRTPNSHRAGHKIGPVRAAPAEIRGHEWPGKKIKKDVPDFAGPFRNETVRSCRSTAQRVGRALAVLLLAPEAAGACKLQMSFAATLALLPARSKSKARLMRRRRMCDVRLNTTPIPYRAQQLTFR